MKPQVSIIVPIYNVEKYLRQCLDSILSQTFIEWECILVDDGATDGSGKVCDEYVRKDTRIKVIHKENGGVCSARNVGIKNAQGEWILFADPDDELLSNALTVMSECTTEGKVDMVSASYRREINGKEIKEYLPSKKQIISANTFIEEISKKKKPRYFHLYCGHILFKKSIIDKSDIHFHEDIYFKENVLFIYEYTSKCVNGVCCLPIQVYVYHRRDEGAVMNFKKVFSPKSVTQLYATIRCYEIIEDMSVSNQTKRNLKNQIIEIYTNIKEQIKSGEREETELEKKIDTSFYKVCSHKELYGYKFQTKWIDYNKRFIIPLKKEIKSIFKL